MITNLTWILTTIMEFYCASLIHLWDSPSLQTANWSHLPESKSANLYWPPSFCPYVLVDEVLLFLLGVNSSIWTLDSFSFPYKGLCSFSYPFFCFISFTCSFGLFSPACKHVLGSIPNSVSLHMQWRNVDASSQKSFGRKWKLGTHFYLNIRAAEERKWVGTGKK